ncbi:MAG: peptidyl-prolyl cis-trans isomerase [Elusimicrobia bacterium]|nr:MAG: peptidyl-prolyl cis-trans isomerase [Elusimicrobiota bacterium]
MSGEDKAGLYAILETSQGTIEARLFPDEAPLAVENFVSLARGEKEWTDSSTKKRTKRSLYEGTLFHRVLEGFMIQGGDPTGTGAGGPGYTFKDEFQTGRSFSKPGILAMANSGPNTNGSQFFITVARTQWLDRRHTIFGEVVRGMETVLAISAVSRNGRDRPFQDQILKSVQIEER